MVTGVATSRRSNGTVEQQHRVLHHGLAKAVRTLGICWYSTASENLTIDRYLTKLQGDVANVTPLSDCVGSPPLCACIHPGMPSNEGLVRVSILQNLLQDIKIYGGESP